MYLVVELILLGSLIMASIFAIINQIFINQENKEKQDDQQDR